MEHTKALMHLQHAANNLLTNVVQHNKLNRKKRNAFGNKTDECSVCHTTALDYVCECKHPKHAMCRSCMQNIQKGEYLRCPQCQEPCIQSYKQVYTKKLTDHHMDTNAESDEKDDKHPDECIVCYGSNADYICEHERGNKEAMCRSCMKEKKGSCIQSYKKLYTKEVTGHEMYHYAGMEINKINLMFQVQEGCIMNQINPQTNHQQLTTSLKTNLMTELRRDSKVKFATNCSFTFKGDRSTRARHRQTNIDYGIRDNINLVIIEIHSPQKPARTGETPREIRRVVNDWISDHWRLGSRNHNEPFTFKFLIIFLETNKSRVIFKHVFRMGSDILTED